MQPTPTRQVADAHGIPVLQPQKIRDEAFLNEIRALQPDLGVVAAFGRILPDDLLAIPTLGMINVHASILPRYRGAAPVQRAVLAGDAETGVTIMRIVSELDAGPTFASGVVPIPRDATSGEIEPVVSQLGARILLPVIEDLAAGRARETPQDASRATFAPKVTKAEGVIDWNESAATIHNKVRGLQPWPLASTHEGGNRYVIRRSVVSNERVDAPPGTVVRAKGDDFAVAAGSGTLLKIEEIQPEGRRPMNAREFLAGRPLSAGDRFGA